MYFSNSKELLLTVEDFSKKTVYHNERMALSKETMIDCSDDDNVAVGIETQADVAHVELNPSNDKWSFSGWELCVCYNVLVAFLVICIFFLAKKF